MISSSRNQMRFDSITPPDRSLFTRIVTRKPLLRRATWRVSRDVGRAARRPCSTPAAAGWPERSGRWNRNMTYRSRSRRPWCSKLLPNRPALSSWHREQAADINWSTSRKSTQNTWPSYWPTRLFSRFRKATAPPLLRHGSEWYRGLGHQRRYRRAESAIALSRRGSLHRFENVPLGS